MSNRRLPRPVSILLSFLAIAAWSGSAHAQSTAPFDILDNVEGDFVNLNAPPVRPMAMTADNLTLFALNTHASRILRFDLVTGANTQVMHTAKSPVSIALWTESGGSPGDRLVVACRDTYAILIHDRTSGDVRKVLELRDSNGRILGEPGDLLVDQATNRAFVSCQATDAVAEIDLTVPSVVRVFRMPCKNPLFMCFDGNNDVLVAPLLSGNNSGARLRQYVGVNPMHTGPTVVDFETAAQNGTQLPDEDLFRLIRSSGVVQPLTTDVGTVQFAVGINPATGQLWQLNTDANNKNPAKQTEDSIRGDIVVNQLSISTLPAIGAPKTTPLARVDLDQVTGTYDPTKSIGQPYALAFGQFGFAVIAGLLTDNVMLVTSAGGYVSEFDLTPGAIPRALLYSPVADRVLVYCWGTNTIDVRQVGLSWTPVYNLSLGLDPTAPKIKAGRTIAYDASHSAKNNASCLSCHIDGRTDMVVWNLGTAKDDKGPMVTQTLDGINKSVPFHWRGEQRNNLADFNSAFVSLLGAGAQLSPSQFSDFEAFIFSLETPPNPFEDETRVVSSTLQPLLPPGAATPTNAINGKTHFNAACEVCHNGPIATNNDSVPDGAGFGDINPRRLFNKVAPFNEIYRKDQDADVTTPGLQTRTVQLLPLSGSGPLETHEYSLLGSGLTHAGLLPSIHHFLDFFFSAGQQQLRADTTAFVRQYDQGIGPAAYRALLINSATYSTASTVMTNYFVPQAVARNCDIVLFGKYTRGGTLIPARYWFDRRLTAPNQFVCDDGSLHSLTSLLNQARAGQASLTCVGLPVGTGRIFGIDFDRDDWINGLELANVPPANPDHPDSDNDGSPDGHEKWNPPGNPMNNSVVANDTTPPVILRAVTQMVTGKVARINVETNEPCVINANYSFSGGPPHSTATLVPSLTHTLILNDLRMMTGGTALNYSGTITAIDLGGLTDTDPLPQMPAYNPGAGPITTRSSTDLPGVSIVGSLGWTSVTKVSGTLTASAAIRIDEKRSGPPELPLANKRVVARIFKNGVLQSAWTPQGTSAQVASFDLKVGLAIQNFDPFAGPFLVSALTSAGGTSTLAFSMTGLVATDVITMNIELVGEEAPAEPFLTILVGSQWNMPSTATLNRELSVIY